jgi:colanic acid/amylovoran biosynthesis glycosyltransferase
MSTPPLGELAGHTPPQPEVLRVLHHVERWLGLTETWIYSQLRHLPATVGSHVVCGSVTNSETYPWPRVHVSSPRHRMRLEPFGAAVPPVEVVVEVAGAVGADVIHSHFGHVGWYGQFAARASGLPHVVTFYGLDASLLPKRLPWWRRRYREMFREVSAVLCEGPHMAARICELGCPPDKVRVHHLGVDVQRIAFRPRKWDGNEPLRILIAGSFREKKGIPYALAAVGHLKRELPVAVTVVGDATPERRSRGEKRRILRMIRDQELDGYVRLVGFRSHAELFEEAYRHHVFLSPSVTALDGDTEGGAPVAIIEMAATGMPVVSTTHCDIPEVLPDGGGLLAPERDVEALVSRLRWLMENPVAWQAVAGRARAHIEQEFDAAEQGRRLARIYSEVVGAHDVTPA